MMAGPTSLRYSSPVALVILATAVRTALDPFLGDRHPFSTYYVAVLLMARYGGVGPSLVTLLLGSLLADYFFIDPRHSLRIGDNSAALDLALYYAVGLSIVVIGRGREDARGRLEREVSERGRAEAGRRDQEERLRATLDGIGDGVLVADAGGRVATLNPVAERLLGWSSAGCRAGVRSARCSA